MPTTVDEVQAIVRELWHPLENPVLLTTEVASETMASRRSVLDKLKSLESDGLVRAKRIEGASTMWWPDPTSLDVDASEWPERYRPADA